MPSSSGIPPPATWSSASSRSPKSGFFLGIWRASYSNVPAELVESLLPAVAVAAADHGCDPLLRYAHVRQTSGDHVAKPDRNRFAWAFPVIVAGGVARQPQADRAAAVHAVDWCKLASHEAVHQILRLTKL